MSTQRQTRRGTVQEHEHFIGAAGEITVVTGENSIRVHDGITPGGHPVASTNELRNDSASQIGLVYIADWFTGIVITNNAMTAKFAYWYNGQFYSVGTDTGFTSNDFDADLAAGRFISAELATNTSVYTLNRSIYEYRDLANNNDWTAAFRQALADNDTVDIGDLNCRVTELNIAVGKTITTNGLSNIMLDNCSANITFTDLAETRVTTALSSFSDVLTVPDAHLFNVGDWILIRFYPDSASGESPIIERSLDLDDWGYQSQLTKIVAITGTQVTIQDKTFCEMIVNQGCYITTNPVVDTNINGNITFTRNSQKSMFVLQSRTKFNKTKFHGSGGLDNIISMNGKSLCSFTDVDFDGFHGGGGVVQCSYGACFNTFTRCTLTDCDGTDGGVIMFYGANNNTVDTMYSLSNDPIQHYYGGVVITGKSWGNTVIGSKFVGGSTGLALLFGAFDNHIIGCSFSAQKYSHVYLNLVDGNSFGFCNFESSNTEVYFYQVYAAASKNVDFSNCKFRGKGLLVSALTWRADAEHLTSTCCFTFTACEFINARIYMNKSASKLSFDNCEFSCTPDVGYQCVMKTYKIDVNQAFNGWVIKNTSFVNAFVCLDGLSFSKIIGNDFDGIDNTVSDTAIDITTTSACNEISSNTFKNYKSITTLNSLESSTTKMFDNVTINVSNKDNAVGVYALDGTAKPNPNFACPANWFIYPHTRDAFQVRTIEAWRSKGNGFTSDAQFVKVMINEEN